MAILSPIDGTAIRCLCCQGKRKKVAELEGTALEIVGHRNGGKQHYSEVTIKDMLEHLAGTQGYAGVNNYVRTLFNGSQ